MRILVVEDDRKLSSFLCRALTEEGYGVDVIEDGRLAIAQCGQVDYDVVILDWMLPSVDGLSACRALRSGGPTMAILMLTARADLQERIAGLDAGADGYLAKPFDLDELLARVRALARRCRSARYLEVGSICVDRLKQVASLEGELLDLTPREFSLLQLLVSEAGRIVTRNDILQRVWAQPADATGNLIEANIKNLRNKLGNHARRIETVRGSGYRWRDNG